MYSVNTFAQVEAIKCAKSINETKTMKKENRNNTSKTETGGLEYPRVPVLA